MTNDPCNRKDKVNKKITENSQEFQELEPGAANMGCGKLNRPRIDNRNPVQKFCIDPVDASETNNQNRPQLTRHCRASKRKAETEFQYRPRIVPYGPKD